MFDEDLDAFFSVDDFAVEASWTPANGEAEQTADVILSSPDELILSGVAQSTEYTMVYPSTKFVGLDDGETVTVIGESYVVRGTPRATDDGKVMRAALSTYG